jgi:hypothetical protein
MSILGTIEGLRRARTQYEPTACLVATGEPIVYLPATGGMSDNQLSEQWRAYRLGPAFDYPHTLNRGTRDAALRRHFRL